MRPQTFKNKPPSEFKFLAESDKLRELLLQWWPEVVSHPQLKAQGPDQRGFIIGGVRL